jgi:hypothetical protein
MFDVLYRFLVFSKIGRIDYFFGNKQCAVRPMLFVTIGVVFDQAFLPTRK